MRGDDGAGKEGGVEYIGRRKFLIEFPMRVTYNETRIADKTSLTRRKRKDRDVIC